MSNHDDQRFDASERPSRTMGATMSDAEGILNPDQARAFAQSIGTSLLGDRCEDVVILDVTKLSPVTGFIVIGSGTSARQMRSALQNLSEVAQANGTSAFRVSEDNDTLWLLADFVDVVVHLFEPNARAHYDLEMMWGDAPRVDVPRPTKRETGRDTGRDGGAGS